MSDIVTSRVFQDGEKGITAQKLNDIVASSVIQPAFYTSKPTASTADPADVMLILKAGAYTQVPVSTVTSGMDASQIWSTRLRSFNAVGNPNFEVDQKQAGTQVVSGAIDRWATNKTGTMVVTAGQVAPGVLPLVPGTNFLISRAAFQVVLSTAQASLGTNDYVFFNQVVEGPNFRELSQDVHSLSLLVYSTVANLKFSVALRDPASANSLVKLCTIPTANTWTLILLPNLPVWASGGNFSSAPGVGGYALSVCLACGPNFTAPTADTWQSGNFVGAPGMSNFAANAVNSQFLMAFVQHEPGPVCSTLMDKPFSQNLDECLRYYQKTYDYNVLPGTVINDGSVQMLNLNGTVTRNVGHRFKQSMAKIPTMLAYNITTGQLNTINNRADNTVCGVTSWQGTTKEHPCYFLNVGGGLTANDTAWVHYTADTGDL